MSKNVRPIVPVGQINMTEGERKSRVECAAGHHLLELYHLTDMVEGVLGVRVEDEPDAYLLKTYRTFFDEVCASDLVKVCFDKEPDQEIGRSLNYSSVAQAGGIFSRRPDINCILHTHIPAATVVASLECGLLPLIQHALIVFNEIVYVDCDTGNDEDAVRDVLDRLGDKKIAMIRNHGVFVLGKSVAEVLFLTITLEYACRCQLDAMQAHAKAKTFDLDNAAQLAAGFTGNPENASIFDGTLQWEGWLRKLDRMGCCYRD